MKLPFLLLASVLAIRTFADVADDQVLAMLQKQHVPGAWLVVMRDGKVIKRKGYGLANIELGVKVTPETMMQTGSIGKMFTAEGILALVKDRKLSLTDSLATFFPEAPEWWKPITIRHLLSHTAGIPEYEGEKYTLDLKKEYTEDEIVQFVQRMTPESAPGEKWAYSNTDYFLLGVIIHKLTGKFYADFLRERVFNPAGMKTIRTNSDTDLIPHRAQGYDTIKGQWFNQDWVSKAVNSTADGTLMACADDMVAWDRALDGKKILPKDLQDLVWQSQKLNSGKNTRYGFAWVIEGIKALAGRHVVWHNGSWQGFVTTYLRLPDDHLSVVLFTNGSNANTDRVAVDIALGYLRR